MMMLHFRFLSFVLHSLLLFLLPPLALSLPTLPNAPPPLIPSVLAAKAVAANPMNERCRQLVSWDESMRNSACNSFCQQGLPVPENCREEPVVINEDGVTTTLTGECFGHWVVGLQSYDNIVESGMPHNTANAANCQLTCQTRYDCQYFIWEAGRGSSKNCLLKLSEHMALAVGENISPAGGAGEASYCPLDVVENCANDPSQCLSCSQHTMSCVRKSAQFVSGPKYCSQSRDLCVWEPSTPAPPPTQPPTTVLEEGGSRAEHDAQGSNLIIMGAAGGIVTTAVGVKLLAHFMRRQRNAEEEQPHSSPSDATCQTITEESYI